jgi:hypothetical protein
VFFFAVLMQNYGKRRYSYPHVEANLTLIAAPSKPHLVQVITLSSLPSLLLYFHFHPILVRSLLSPIPSRLSSADVSASAESGYPKHAVSHAYDSAFHEFLFLYYLLHPSMLAAPPGESQLLATILLRTS